MFLYMRAEHALILARGEAAVEEPITPRQLLSFFMRTFPGWDCLRKEIAGALGVSLDQVCGLTEDVDPAVRLDAHAFALGFQVAVELYIDPKRAQVPSVESLAPVLARRLGVDVAHHDGSMNPYGYVLVRANGDRFAVDELIEESDGLCLDEAEGSLRRVPSEAE